ncbi:MAG: tetraacyldisaccharide 4'-kinase [Myxococcota bacterium]
MRALYSPLDVAGWAVTAGARIHRTLYERGWRARRRLPCAVVSIGNLTVGGTGKTPTAAWLAHQLSRRGRRVALASRGYGRRFRRELTVVSDGRRVLAPLERSGDEPLWLAARAPGVPVLVDADRGVAGIRAVGQFDVDILVLDDGFQHHRLDRDLEIVLVDGRSGFGNRRVFPRGPLRERLPVLSRAHAAVVVDGPLPDAEAARLARFAPGALRIAARRRPVGLRPLAGRVDGQPFGCPVGPGFLAGRPVGVLTALARPESLVSHLEALGAQVVARRTFRDHHRYRRRDLRGLGRRAPLWITTEKDAFKIQPGWARGVDVQVLVMELEVDEGAAFVDWVDARAADALARHGARRRTA